MDTTHSSPTVALIDGDILAYRIGFASETQSEGICKARLDTFISDLLLFGVSCEDYEGYITGKGNFRDAIAVTAPYKGNRPDKKPLHYDFIRNRLQDYWGFHLINGEEADDAISIMATTLGDRAIICSIDKDFLQVPTHHFNFVKREYCYVEPHQGLRSFYGQILTGDRVDNVIGLRGVGPVTAGKILGDCPDEQALYETCVSTYSDYCELLPEKPDAKARVKENGQLLWLRRYPGQIWLPPNERTE